MPGHRNPTVRREELGAALRALRQEAGLSIEDVTNELGISMSQISRIEKARRRASIPDVIAMCGLYNVPRIESERLIDLARGAKETPWWERYIKNIASEYGKYIGLEDTAVAIYEYKSDVLPGLLQTEGYARAIIGSIDDRNRRNAEMLVTLRLRRQQILDRAEPPELHVLLDEATLHRTIGSREVMREQLDKLLTLSSNLPHVSVRVVPFSAGAHAALGYLFTIVRLPQEALADAVYFEGAQQAFVDNASEVARFTDVFESASRVALDSAASRDLIRRIMEDMYA